MVLFNIQVLAINVLIIYFLFLSIKRVVNHLKGNPAATAAVAEHVLVPVFGDAHADESLTRLGEERRQLLDAPPAGRKSASK